MRLQRLPIRRKIMAVIMLTSITVVTLTVFAFMAYDLTTVRDTTVTGLTTMGRIVADNSSGAVTFKNERDAQETLASLRALQQGSADADRDGKPRRLQVKVDRRKVTVRSRQWVVIPQKRSA